MNARLTLTAGAAVILASVSLYPVVSGGWFWAGAGAVAVTGIAGALSRLGGMRAAAAAVLALAAAAPLLASGSVYMIVTGAAIVTIAAAGATRRSVLPAAACLITYLTALLLYLNAVFAARASLVGFVPTGASVTRLWTLTGHGIATAWMSGSPAPGTPGIILLTTAGIGAAAIVTDLLAVRLRHPAAAGLPLLALFGAPMTTKVRQDAMGAAVVFGLAVAGYLALLAADRRQQLASWGPLMAAWHSRDDRGQRPDTRPLGASGRRIGLAAVTLAVILPLFVPLARAHPLFGPSASGGGPGTGGTGPSLPSPLVQLSNDLRQAAPQTVLTYTTTNPDPAGQYLQVYVLNFDRAGYRWVLAPQGPSAPATGHALQPPPGLAASTPRATVKTRVMFARGARGYQSRWNALPFPYAPARLRAAGRWRESTPALMVYSTRTTLSGLSYTAESVEAEPTDQVLSHPGPPPANITGSYADFPDLPGHQLATIARQVTRGAATAIQKALKLQAWFRSRLFSYNLHVNLPGTPQGLLQFLTKTRRGYCQQFAFAMAALARFVGIPSRVAVGYTAGTPAGGGRWRVTTSDMHAWPELYFQGAGWLRFEPTPAGPAGQGTATTPSYLTGPATLPIPPTTGSHATSPKENPAPGARKPGNATGQRHNWPGPNGSGGGQHQRGGSSLPGWLLAAAVLMLPAITPRAARSLTRRRRWLSATGDAGLAHAAWRELRDDLADHGITPRASESPRATARRIYGLVHLDGAARRALDRVTRAEEQACYARSPQPSDMLRADSHTIRRAISQSARPGQRWRARLLPASALASPRSALRNIQDRLPESACQNRTVRIGHPAPRIGQ